MVGLLVAVRQASAIRPKPEDLACPDLNFDSSCAMMEFPSAIVIPIISAGQQFQEKDRQGDPIPGWKRRIKGLLISKEKIGKIISLKGIENCGGATCKVGVTVNLRSSDHKYIYEYYSVGDSSLSIGKKKELPESPTPDPA